MLDRLFKYLSWNTEDDEYKYSRPFNPQILEWWSQAGGPTAQQLKTTKRSIRSCLKPWFGKQVIGPLMSLECIYVDQLLAEDKEMLVYVFDSFYKFIIHLSVVDVYKICHRKHEDIKVIGYEIVYSTFWNQPLIKDDKILIYDNTCKKLLSSPYLSLLFVMFIDKPKLQKSLKLLPENKEIEKLEPLQQLPVELVDIIMDYYIELLPKEILPRY